MKKELSKLYIYLIVLVIGLGLSAVAEENDGITYFRQLEEEPVYVDADEASGLKNRLSDIKTLFHRTPKIKGIGLEDEQKPVERVKKVEQVKVKKSETVAKPEKSSSKVVKKEVSEQTKVSKDVNKEEKILKSIPDKVIKEEKAVVKKEKSKPAVVPSEEVIKVKKEESVKTSEQKESEFKPISHKKAKEIKKAEKQAVDALAETKSEKKVEDVVESKKADYTSAKMPEEAPYTAAASMSDKEKKAGSKSKKRKSLFKKNTQPEEVVVNKLYLDRFREDNQADTEAYYKARNLLVKPNGEVELILQSDDEKGIDTLIKEIEATSPDDTFTPPIKLSLRDSIGIAIAKHPSIKSARLSADIYKARIIEAWASYFPTFSANFDITHTYTKTRHYGSYKTNTGTIPNVSAGLLLFDFGKTKTNVDIASVDYSASKYDLQDTINELIYSVKAAYYDVLFAQHQVDVYNKMIEEFDLQVRSAKKFFSIGKKAEIDVITAEYNAGNARLNLVKANNTLENAKVTFANTLGLPEFANYTLSDELPREEYKTDLETLLQDAFYIRPDLISAEKSLENAKLSVRKAWRAFTPDITANGNGGYSRADNMGTTSYAISANMNYSINYLELKKGLDIAKISYEKAKSDYELKKQAVYLEVKKAYIDLNNSLNSVYQADENMASAKAQNYHATGRYNAGLSTAIELKDSENTYMNSQLEYYNALLNYNNAIANLERVVGRPIDSVITQQSSSNGDAETTGKSKLKNKKKKSL